MSPFRTKAMGHISSASVRAALIVWLLTVHLIEETITVEGNAEGDALSVFRRHLIDPEEVLMSWDPSLVTPCTWFHVFCNLDNRVVLLDLHQSALSGTLVPELANLTSLQHLLLDSNNITGYIPEEIGYLRNLITLDLSQNALTGPIPKSFGGLDKIRSLRLDNNFLTGAIPPSLAKLSNLSSLNLAYNNLSGVSPSFLPSVLTNFTGNPYLTYPVVTSQVELLIALRQSLKDPNQVLSSWDSSLINPCTWFHITCNADNLVIRIDLGNAGLSGNLVPQLGNLTSLQYLEMFGNSIGGYIPPELGYLSNLVSLDLSGNRKLSGFIPDSFADLRELRVLRLNNNSLVGSIPEVLTGLPNLQVVDLSYNKLAGVIPNFSSTVNTSFIGNPGLTTISSMQSRIEVESLIALRQSLKDPNQVLLSWDSSLVNPCDWFHITCNLDNLVIRIDLGNASLSGNLVPQLGNLTSLQYLQMFSNDISGTIPKEIGYLTNLAFLHLYDNNLTGSIPDSLGGLENLIGLRLNNNSLTGHIPRSLTRIVNLQVINLSFNNLTGVVPDFHGVGSDASFVGNPYLRY